MQPETFVNPQIDYYLPLCRNEPVVHWSAGLIHQLSDVLIHTCLEERVIHGHAKYFTCAMYFNFILVTIMWSRLLFPFTLFHAMTFKIARTEGLRCTMPGSVIRLWKDEGTLTSSLAWGCLDARTVLNEGTLDCVFQNERNFSGREGEGLRQREAHMQRRESMKAHTKFKQRRDWKLGRWGVDRRLIWEEDESPECVRRQGWQDSCWLPWRKERRGKGSKGTPGILAWATSGSWGEGVADGSQAHIPRGLSWGWTGTVSTRRPHGQVADKKWTPWTKELGNGAGEKGSPSETLPGSTQQARGPLGSGEWSIWRTHSWWGREWNNQSRSGMQQGE